MRVLVVSSPRFLDHVGHPARPERPERLGAVLTGIERHVPAGARVDAPPRPAPRDALEAVHDPGVLDALEAFSAAGGGIIDLNTAAGPDSWDVAVLAAGAGLEAIARLDAGEADAAFIAARPPGHHATARRPQGFCLLNNVAVAAAALAARGERVLVIDWDVHHGNGTQDIFYEDPRVAYVSLHQWPQYPGTGRREETGAGAGEGTTLNVPVPAGTTGDTFLAAFDELIGPFAERFRPTWVLVSSGFDAHRRDPIAELDLSAGDYALLAQRVVLLVPRGRCIAFLEGGYDLGALAQSAGATVAALAGLDVLPEPPTSGGAGHAAVREARAVHGI